MELLKKVVDYFTWVIFVGLFFLGLIIYVTNTTYPGDKLYSFKLKFEDFVLATSSVLNRQVDFSIDLVSKRSKEVAKILTASNSQETLNRLDIQVELTAASISQISDPVERKKAAEVYVTKLNETSTILSEKEKELLASSTTYSPPTNTESQSNDVFPTSQPTMQPTTQSASSALDPVAEPTVTSSTTQPTTQPTTKPEPTTPTALPTAAPITNTSTNTNVSQQIANSQLTIKQTIVLMNNIADKSEKQEVINNRKEKNNKLKNGKFGD